jgi:carbon monoxide dehydrogenase subunit G
MEIKHEGDFEVSLSRSTTFEVLAAPEIFAPALPRIRSIRKAQESGSSMLRFDVGNAGILGVASTELSLVECDAPKIIRYEGKGRFKRKDFRFLAGIRLESVYSGGTHITWESTASINSRILRMLGVENISGYAEREIATAIVSLQSLLEEYAHFED